MTVRQQQTPKRLECRYCDHVSRGPGEDRRHRRQEHPPETRRYTCEVCGQEFAGAWSLSAFNRHMKFHATDLGERFFSHVHMTSGCWLWKSARCSKGYGVFSIQEKPVSAHRIAYLNIVGPIPDETPELDHLCRTPLCVRPEHLEPVTRLENMRRAHAAQPKRSCADCDFTTRNLSAYLNHRRWKHSEVTTETPEGGRG